MQRYTVYFIWKHVEQFPDKINCVTLHLVGRILENAWRNIYTPHTPLRSQCLIKHGDNFSFTGHKLATFHLPTDSGTKISLKVDLLSTAIEPHYKRPLFD